MGWAKENLTASLVVSWLRPTNSLVSHPVVLGISTLVRVLTVPPVDEADIVLVAHSIDFQVLFLVAGRQLRRAGGLLQHSNVGVGSRSQIRKCVR